jgi:hypothetical protein
MRVLLVSQSTPETRVGSDAWRVAPSLEPF